MSWKEQADDILMPTAMYIIISWIMEESSGLLTDAFALIGLELVTAVGLPLCGCYG